MPDSEHPTTAARYAGKCSACGDQIDVGEILVKDADEEWVHEDCLGPLDTLPDEDD